MRMNGVLLKVSNSDIVDGAFVIPSIVTSIAEGAFAYCDSLTTITIPDTITSIGDCAFEYCYSLTSVTISNNVTNIGNYAFLGCKNLTNIAIPDSVTSIGRYAFGGCNSLSTKKANYKAFNIRNGELYCHDKKYSEGIENSVQGALKICKNGIHYSTNLFEIFNYYHGELDKDIAIYEIEVGDKVVTLDDSKCCTNSCLLKTRLYRKDIIRILNGEEE